MARYSTMTPAQATRKLTKLGFDRVRAEAAVSAYLEEAAAKFGTPATGWELDEHDITEIERARHPALSVADWHAGLPEKAKDDYEQLAIDDAAGTGQPPELDDVRAGRVADPRHAATLGTIGNPDRDAAAANDAAERARLAAWAPAYYGAVDPQTSYLTYNEDDARAYREAWIDERMAEAGAERQHDRAGAEIDDARGGGAEDRTQETSPEVTAPTIAAVAEAVAAAAQALRTIDEDARSTDLARWSQADQPASADGEAAGI